MLTISVKNFGPIAEGSVDLKPLTIFVGPSNTGKSYMATAVYAVMRAARRWGQLVTTEGRTVTITFTAIPYGQEPVETDEFTKVLNSLRNWDGLKSETNLNPSELSFSSLPEDVRSWLAKETGDQLVALQKNVVGQLRRIHGNPSEFVKRGCQIEGFHLDIRQSDPLLKMKIVASESYEKMPEFDVGNISLPTAAIEYLRNIHLRLDANLSSSHLSIILAAPVAEAILADTSAPTHFLPAARSGIVNMGKPFLAELARSEHGVAGVPIITREFLGSLVGLNPQADDESWSDDLKKTISFLENKVLLGWVDLDQTSDLPYPDIVYQTDSGKFTIDRTSSMVSELAPLILFLKYLVRPGDLLILEEPESHLHPAAQRQLARGIVRLVNAGVKVLITTHSDIFVSQINNLLALSQASGELIAEQGFEEADFLTQEQVGAYLFRYNQDLGGSSVSPLEIDSDTGIDEDEFAEVFEAIYNESIALQRDRD